MSGKLSGKVAIVTGASKGIGAAIATHLADAGAAVVVNYSKSKEYADIVVSRIQKNGGKALAIQTDVANADDLPQLFANTINSLGRVDVLVNNAGVYEFASLDQITAEHFHRQFDLNVLSLLLATKEAVRHFGPAGGSIVNISSVVAKAAPANTSVYSASKAAVDAITSSLAKELGPRNIRVNAINPGLVETEGARAQSITEGDFRKQVEAQTPLGRIGRPDDIGPAAVFLASEEAKWITGETLFITGGYQ